MCLAQDNDGVHTFTPDRSDQPFDKARGICRDVDPDEISAAEPNDDEGIDQVETDSWNNEQVHGGNVWSMTTQEGSPSLAGWPRRLTMDLATLDCATSNPSLSSSPWMRSAPESGFLTLIRRINTRSSVSIYGPVWSRILKL
jgi:hypothetical protein